MKYEEQTARFLEYQTWSGGGANQFDATDIAPLDNWERTRDYILAQFLIQGWADEVVVAGSRNGKLGGIKIDFTLDYPQEQMWLLTYDSRSLTFPRRSKKSCVEEKT